MSGLRCLGCCVFVKHGVSLCQKCKRKEILFRNINIKDDCKKPTVMVETVEETAEMLDKDVKSEIAHQKKDFRDAINHVGEGTREAKLPSIVFEKDCVIGRHRPFRNCRKRKHHPGRIPGLIYRPTVDPLDDENDEYEGLEEAGIACEPLSDDDLSSEDELVDSCSDSDRSDDTSECDNGSYVEDNNGLDDGNHHINIWKLCCENAESTDKLPICRNCFREEKQIGDPVYHVALQAVCKDELSCAGKWKSFVKADIPRGETHVLLCRECRSLLDKDADVKQDWCYIWPVYIWLLISNDKMIQKYGADVVRFIPKEWHVYWATALCRLNKEIFNVDSFVSYHNGICVTKDVTSSRNAFVGVTKRLKLGELKQGCNKYLVPLVLCPWGCTSYSFHEGHVSMDAVYGRFFGFINHLGSIKPNETEKLMSCREDFLEDLIDAWYFNPEWTVHPSVSYLKGRGPVFLTCKDHNGGTFKRYFHLPRTEHCLPTRHSDSLSHAVLRARTLRPCKAHKYSHTFQLNKTVAHYGGIDSTTVTTERRFFDYASHLTDITEARSFRCRADIRGLLEKLVKSGVVSREFLFNTAQRSNDLYGDGVLLDKRSKAGTMMNLCDAIKLQKMISTPVSFSIYHQQSNIYINRLWPSDLVFIHPNNSYGGRFSNYKFASAMQTQTDYRCLWVVSNALLCIPSLWNAVSRSVKSSDHWEGFLLAFLSKRILHGRCKRSNDRTNNPFHITQNDQRMKPNGLQSLLLGSKNNIGKKNLPTPWNTSSLFKIFQRCMNQKRLVIDNLQRNTLERIASHSLLANLPDECDTLMFIRPQGARLNVPLPLSLGEGKDMFELRFICCSYEKEGYSKDGNKWDGTIYARHGGALFFNWWGIDRASHPYHVSDIDVKWDNVDVVVYVRCSSTSVEEYRKQYLTYIGGQDKAWCQKHDVPLITSKSKRGEGILKCSCIDCHSGGNSRSNQEFSCPVEGCPCGICDGCYKVGDKGKIEVPGGSNNPIDSSFCYTFTRNSM